MTQIDGDVVVDCPTGEAAAYLAETFERLGPKGGPAVLALCVPVGDVTIAREVIVRIAQPKAAPGRRVLSVTWTPKNGGPYPNFSGTLALTDHEPHKCQLTIGGSYGPPGGLAGVAFDAVVGRRMANASLKALLLTLKAAIETAHADRGPAAPNYLPSYE